MQINDVHFIQDVNQNTIAFFPNSKRFFKVNENGRKIIELILNNYNDNEIQKSLNITKESINKYRELLKLYVTSIPIENLNDESNKNKQLSRLVIHVANSCNLKCRYCYANGGVYNSAENILDYKTLDKTLEYFYNKFDKIASLQMFGGEPLVSIPMVKYICEKIRKDYNDSEIILSIVTNGTLITDEFIDIVKKYNIIVTISYDGNELINDMLRIYPNNSGTSKTIIENANKLKKLTNQPSTIEVTYTQFHADNNVSVLDVIKHIYDAIPNTSIHLVPAAGEDKTDFVLRNLKAVSQSVNEIFDFNIKERDNEIYYSFSLMERIISSITNKFPGSPFICDAGIGTLSVSVEGNIYPCFMFTDVENVCLGNVFDFDPLATQESALILNNLKEFNTKEKNDKCSSCFIKTMCSSCLGINYIQKGDIHDLDEATCEMYRDMADQVIINLAKHSKTLN